MYRLILFVLCVIIVNSFKHQYPSSLRRYKHVTQQYNSLTMTVNPTTSGPKVVNVDKIKNIAQLSVTYIISKAHNDVGGWSEPQLLHYDA